MGTAAVIIAALVCGWAFQAGKRQGSRKGYFAGRKKANRKNSGKRSGRWL